MEFTIEATYGSVYDYRCLSEFEHYVKEDIAKAVEKAVEIEVHKAVEKAAKDATRKIEADIHREVANEVNSRYDDIKSVVLKEISASAAKPESIPLSERHSPRILTLDESL